VTSDDASARALCGSGRTGPPPVAVAGVRTPGTPRDGSVVTNRHERDDRDEQAGPPKPTFPVDLERRFAGWAPAWDRS